MDGVALSFEDDMLDYVVEMAIQYKLGARGLRSIVETVMMDAMYEIPASGAQTLVITREYAANKFERVNRLHIS